MLNSAISFPETFAWMKMPTFLVPIKSAVNVSHSVSIELLVCFTVLRFSCELYKCSVGKFLEACRCLFLKEPNESSPV